MIALYVSTEKWDIVSAVIRWFTLCSWSHVGFINLDTMTTFSAMADGRGVDFRPLKRGQKIMLLDAPHCEEAYQKALSYKGQGYDFLAILGMVFHRNWKSRDRKFCNELVFRVFDEIGEPLLNHKFIPLQHMFPEHILLSPKVTLRPN